MSQPQVIQLPLPEPDMLTFSLECRRSGDFLSVLPRILVNGLPIGLISSLEIKARADEAYPEVIVRIGEGLTKEQIEAVPESVRESALRYEEELRKFPFVRVESSFTAT